MQSGLRGFSEGRGDLMKGTALYFFFIPQTALAISLPCLIRLVYRWICNCSLGYQGVRGGG